MKYVPLALIREPARLAGYPGDKGKLIARLAREGARRITGDVSRGQKGFLYEYASLPQPIRSGLDLPETDATAPVPFERYMAAPQSQKIEADRRILMMHSLKRKLAKGVPASACYAMVADEFSVSASTVKRAWRRIRKAHETDWLALLVKDYKGREPDDIAPEILATFFADYGRVEQPQLQAVHERTVKEAARHGWGPVPSPDTLKRRWDALPIAQRIYMRKGQQALADAYPSIERDRSDMMPTDMFNGDGRTLDLFVRLKDGRERRIILLAVQDEATNKILGWTLSETESGTAYRSVIAKVFTEYFIPERFKFDNTRAAANKMLTGKAKNRYRFKDNPEDCEGLLLRVGCRPIFAQPYNGKSKPVERAFGEIKERIEKDPRCAGAYTGPSTTKKPANYGQSAVPIELLETIVTGAIEHYNTRIDRRSKVAYRTSYNAVFEQRLSSIPVRRLTDAQRRYFFLDVAHRTVSPSGKITLGKEPHITTYWSETLREHAGRKVAIRFDPDDYSVPVLVETLDGRLIDDEVPRFGKTGWNNKAQADAHQRAKRESMKAAKKAADAIRRMEEIEAGKHLPPNPATSPAPSAPVVAPDFKIKPASRGPVGGSVDTDALDKALARFEQEARYG